MVSNFNINRSKLNTVLKYIIFLYLIFNSLLVLYIGRSFFLGDIICLYDF